MAPAVKGNEAPHPLQVALLGLVAHVPHAHLLARNLEEPTSLWR
jgi:hypothetical protein